MWSSIISIYYDLFYRQIRHLTYKSDLSFARGSNWYIIRDASLNPGKSYFKSSFITRRFEQLLQNLFFSLINNDLEIYTRCRGSLYNNSHILCKSSIKIYTYTNKYLFKKEKNLNAFCRFPWQSLIFMSWASCKTQIRFVGQMTNLTIKKVVIYWNNWAPHVLLL